MLVHTMYRSSKSIFNIVALVVLFATTAYATEALKNHAPEKRQDDSFLFFGGWRPIKPGTRYHHRSPSGKYHDLLSAIPETLDTSSTYYSSSHSNYNKDIYNYYPRPAIRSSVKGKPPIYMESTKRRRNPQQRKHGLELVVPGLHGVNIQHLKGLHDVLLSQIPLSGLTSLPLHGGKTIELAVQPLSQLSGFSQHGGSSQKNRNGYHGHRSTSSNIPYVSSQPIDLKSAVNFGISKGLPLVPVKLPEVEEALDLKNIQIVEIPVPVHASEVSKGKVASRYDKRGNKGGDRNNYYHGPESQMQIRYEKAYSPPNFKQFQQYSPSPMLKQQVNDYPRKQKHQQIAAELITISDDQIKSLLKNFHTAGKTSNDLLKYLPLTDIKNHDNENLHLVVALPQGHRSQQVHGGQQESAYQGSIPSSHSKHSGYQEIQLQILDEPQHHGNYETEHDQGSNSHSQGNGYRVVEEQRNSGYQEADPYMEGNQYQTEGKDDQYHQHQEREEDRYQHQQSNYDDQQNDHQQSQPHIISYQKDKRGQAYIEVNAHVDENGYKREPVLAVELQKGQTIEDAIKALDPETLQKLGANTKDGIEIEVVEIPVDEYGAESKKQETIVSKNSTMSSTTVLSMTTVSPTTSKSS